MNTRENKKMLKLLIGARSCISNEKNWTTGSWARDVNGVSVCVTSDSAVQFCVEGALYREQYENDALELRWDLHLDPFTPDKRVFADFNDDATTNHDDVLTMFDWAIGSLKAEMEMRS